MIINGPLRRWARWMNLTKMRFKKTQIFVYWIIHCMINMVFLGILKKLSSLHQAVIKSYLMKNKRLYKVILCSIPTLHIWWQFWTCNHLCSQRNKISSKLWGETRVKSSRLPFLAPSQKLISLGSSTSIRSMFVR